MEDLLPTFRTLIAVGFALLLVMLRLEAASFGAAEYDDPIDGRMPSLRRRIAWYSIGMELTQFETNPGRYKHWKLSIDGDVATLVMAVDNDHPH